MSQTNKDCTRDFRASTSTSLVYKGAESKKHLAGKTRRCLASVALHGCLASMLTAALSRKIEHSSTQFRHVKSELHKSELASWAPSRAEPPVEWEALPFITTCRLPFPTYGTAILICESIATLLYQGKYCELLS